MNVNNWEECPYCLEYYDPRSTARHECKAQWDYCQYCNLYYTIQQGHRCEIDLAPFVSAIESEAEQLLHKKLDYIIKRLDHIIENLNNIESILNNIN